MRSILLSIVIVSAALCAAQDAQGDGVELNIYDVADLTNPVTDYCAPIMTLQFSGGNVADPFAGNGVMAHFGVPQLVALLHDRAFPAEFADPATSIAENNGTLVVMQRKSVQQKIAQFLSELRAVAKTQVAIKGLLIPAAEIPTSAVLDADSLAKALGPQGAAAALAAPRVVCFNGQISHARSGKTFSYIRDYDIAGAVYDPVIGMALDGYTFEVHPALSADGAAAEVNVRFNYGVRTGKTETRSLFLAPPVALETMRPDAKAADGEAPRGVTLPIDMPSMSIQSLNTALRVPLGKWVLAGAMTNPNPEAKEKRLLFFVSAEKLTPPRAP